jgi:hypothetical protein
MELRWKSLFLRPCFTSALNLTFSPGEKEQPQAGSGFADDCPANPVVRILKKTANDSPSPWGEGRDEGGRDTGLEAQLLWTIRKAGNKVQIVNRDGQHFCCRLAG